MKTLTLPKKHRGIGLLELLLSLTIIAIILLLVGRYYITTRLSYQINEAVNMVNASYSAGSSWIETKGKWSGDMVQTFIDHGLLPDNFAQKNPWGGTIRITQTSSTGGGTDFKVDLTEVPNKACKNMQVTFEGMMGNKVKVDSCGAGDNFGITFIEFPS